MDTTQPTQKGLEKLTRAKMAQRRGKRLCFNCDDLYTPDHVCKHVLFYIQQIPDGEHEEDEIIEKEVEISLNALNRAQTETTFQVQADIATGKGWVYLIHEVPTTS